MIADVVRAVGAFATTKKNSRIGNMKTNSLKLVPFEPRCVGWDGTTPIYSGYRMLSYTSHDPERTEWRENTPFLATLDLVGSERGRSSVIFWFIDSITNTKYPMFVSSLESLILNSTLEYGTVSGGWISVKRGSNYGIERYEGVIDDDTTEY